MKRKYNQNRKTSMKKDNLMEAITELRQLLAEVEKAEKVDADKLLKFANKSKLHLMITKHILDFVVKSNYNRDPWMDFADTEDAYIIFIERNMFGDEVIREFVKKYNLKV